MDVDLDPEPDLGPLIRGSGSALKCHGSPTLPKRFINIAPKHGQKTSDEVMLV